MSTTWSTKLVSMASSPGQPSPRATLVAEHAPDQARQPGREDDLGRRVQFGQRPPSPRGYPVRNVHRRDISQLPAGLMDARQEMTFVLPDDPVTVLQHPHAAVQLTQQGDIVPAGLLGELAAQEWRSRSAPSH